MYDLEKRKVTDLFPAVENYDLAPDGDEAHREDRREDVPGRRAEGRAEARRRQARPLGPARRARPAGRVAADLPRDVAPLPRLLLPPRHGEDRLGRHPQALRASRRARLAPLRPHLRPLRGRRRARLGPRLRRRRRRAEGREGPRRPPRRRPRARREGRPLEGRPHPPRAELERDPPLAAHRAGREREGGRLPPRDRRPRPDGEGRAVSAPRGELPRRVPLRPDAAHGHPPRQRAARRGRCPRGRREADRQRGRASLRRLGRDEPEEGRGRDERPRRLRPHPEHGWRRSPGVHPPVLPAAAQGGARRRRPRQRRRLRLRDDPRAAAPAP